MLHTISASQISAEMHAISKLNLYIQKDNVLHRKWEKHLSKCTCSYSQDAEEVYDEDHSEHLSSHERLNYWAKKTERNERIIALHDKLMDVGSLRAAGSKLRLIFGLTDAGNPAIQVKIDNMRVHDRPLTPKTLAPILVELADCLTACLSMRRCPGVSDILSSAIPTAYMLCLPSKRFGSGCAFSIASRRWS
jgi:hypothetical protein